MTKIFRTEIRWLRSDDRKMDLLGEGESIFEGALDLGEERGCQTSNRLTRRRLSTALICSVTTLDANVRRATPLGMIA